MPHDNLVERKNNLSKNQNLKNARGLYHRLRNPDLNSKQEKIKNKNGSCIELLLGCRLTPPSPLLPRQKDKKREASQSESLEDTIFVDFIQYCFFIRFHCVGRCWIEHGAAATLTLAIRRNNHSAI
jgi:hypothetical protein